MLRFRIHIQDLARVGLANLGAVDKHATRAGQLADVPRACPLAIHEALH